ncbi:MAG: HAD family phosphatase [Rhodospirillales bacterium]|nr:HAD family phosphatase [Rhodospirillales bacterium]
MTAQAAMLARRAKLRLVIFDCDGVLVDSEPVSNRLLAADLTARGWPMPTQEATRRFVGASLPAMRPVVEARLGRALPADWEMTLQKRIAAALAEEATPIPGALAALRAVTAMGIAWRIASNSSHTEMAAKFRRLGIAGLVGGRVHSFTDVARGKPAPDLFLAAAAAAGVVPAECVVIEDSVPGVQGAIAAGMDCLGFAPLGDGAALRAAGAVPFHAMTDLPALVAVARRRAA